MPVGDASTVGDTVSSAVTTQEKPSLSAGYTIKVFTRERKYPHGNKLDRVIRLGESGVVEFQLTSIEERLYKFHIEGVADGDFTLLRAVDA